MGRDGRPRSTAHFAGRDELITELIRDAYRSLADTLGAASAGIADGLIQVGDVVEEADRGPVHSRPPELGAPTTPPAPAPCTRFDPRPFRVVRAVPAVPAGSGGPVTSATSSWPVRSRSSATA
ncbi:hypothetical protein SMICM304S_11118 [Streptomyces microflavus]